jgi:hypothetical protein
MTGYIPDGNGRHCRPNPREGVRSFGVVKLVLMSATGACEGAKPREDRIQNSEPRTPNLKPSKAPPIIVATNQWLLLARAHSGIASAPPAHRKTDAMKKTLTLVSGVFPRVSQTPNTKLPQPTPK